MVGSTGTLPWLRIDRVQPNRQFSRGSIVESTRWSVLRRPSEPAAVPVQVAHSTRMEGECLRNKYRKIPDTASSAIPNNLQAHTGIHENPVLWKPGTSSFSFLTAFGLVTAYSPKKSITTNTNRNPAWSFICTQNSLPRKPLLLVNEVVSMGRCNTQFESNLQ